MNAYYSFSKIHQQPINNQFLDFPFEPLLSSGASVPGVLTRRRKPHTLAFWRFYVTMLHRNDATATKHIWL